MGANGSLGSVAICGELGRAQTVAERAIRTQGNQPEIGVHQLSADDAMVVFDWSGAAQGRP